MKAFSVLRLESILSSFAVEVVPHQNHPSLEMVDCSYLLSGLLMQDSLAKKITKQTVSVYFRGGVGKGKGSF